MNNFKAGDTVKIASYKDFLTVSQIGYQDEEQLLVVDKVEAPYVFLKGLIGGWMPHRFVKVEVKAVPASAPFVQARQKAFDGYVTSRLRLHNEPKAIPGGPRNRFFNEGYTQGYAAGLLVGRGYGVYGEALARSTDPSNSQKAAAIVAPKVGKLVDLILHDLQANGPATAAIVAQRIGRPLNAISPRFAPMVRRGLVHVSGGEQGNGSPRSVYKIGNGVA